MWQSPYLPHLSQDLGKVRLPRGRAPLQTLKQLWKLQFEVPVGFFLNHPKFTVWVYELDGCFPFQGGERSLVAQVSLYFSVTKWVPGRESSFNFQERWELMSWEEREVSCNISYKAQGSMTWWDTFLCDAGSEQGVLWPFRDLLDLCHWFIFLIMICDLLPFSHFCTFSSFPSYLFTFRGCKFLSCNCQVHIQHPCITMWN